MEIPPAGDTRVLRIKKENIDEQSAGRWADGVRRELFE
jgi:hypothetical protein